MFKTLKPLRLLLVVSLLFSVFMPFTAGAEENDTSATRLNMDFSDVSVNWSYKHITKLALLNVINGRGNGLFAPNEEVYKQDVLLMAVSLMGVTQEELEENASSIVLPPEMSVSPYAKGYVITAMLRGLLDTNEVETVEDGLWGKQIATREWVARVVIRAIGQQDKAVTLADQESGFADRGMISEGYKGYINAAVELNIVNGMPGNVFNPTDEVTRAQMAVFLSLAEKYLEEPSDRVFRGYLKSMDGDSIELINEQGDVTELERTSFTRLFSYLVNNKTVASTDFEPGMEVYVIHHQGDAYYVEITNEEINEDILLESEQPDLKTVAGTIIDVDTTNNEIVARVNDQVEIFALGNELKIENQQGAAIGLEELVPGSKVLMTQSILDDAVEIKEIVVENVPVSKVDTGLIQEIDLQQQELSVSSEASAQTESYPFIEEIAVSYKGQAYLLESLNPGDEITFTVENSILTAIELINPIEPIVETVSGRFDNVNLQSRVFTMLVGQDPSTEQPQSFYLADEIEVVLSGKPDASLADLQLLDDITVVINSDSRIEKIEILNRTVELQPMASIVSYEQDIKSLVVRAEFAGNSQLKVFNLSDSTVIHGQALSAYTDQAELDSLLAEGRIIDLVYSGEILNEISEADRYTGEIVDIQADLSMITLNTARFGLHDFVWDGDTEILDITGDVESIEELAVGTDVTVELNASGKVLQQIHIKQSVYGTVSSVDTVNQKTVLQLANGKVVTVDLEAEVQLEVSGVVDPTVQHISTKAAAFLLVTGEQVDELYIGNHDYGKITDIDGNTVTVLNYDGETVKLSDFWNIQNDETKAQLTVGELGVNDRVQYAVGPSGEAALLVLSAKQKTFWKADLDDNEVYFQRSSIYEDNRFSLSEQAFIHEQWNEIKLNDFANDDKVIYYMHDGEIVELEKQ